MQELYKIETSGVQVDETLEWPNLSVDRFSNPSKYLPSPELVAAVNVALSLGRPLLLTGEPGTGKSRLAESIAFQLGHYPSLQFSSTPLRFNVRSTSVARELFYSFDNMRKFSDYSIIETAGERQPNLEYLTLNELGIAFLLTQPAHELYIRIPTDLRPKNAAPQRSVVLIDEIDKAPRDFPNDLLNQIDAYAFQVPELAESSGSDGPTSAPIVQTTQQMRPVIVITSNSEKHLPDAFLRRCVFFHIDFPDQASLTKIVESRFAGRAQPSRELLASALDFFFEIRDKPAAPQKKPGTAEFLDWFDVLTNIENSSEGSMDLYSDQNTLLIKSTLSVLAKTREDLLRAERLFLDRKSIRSQSGAA